jgi:hypothetical protein
LRENGGAITDSHNRRVGTDDILGTRGSVAQGTNNSTDVTKHATHGRITMFGTLANGAGATFNFINNKIQANSLILLQVQETTATAAATRACCTVSVENTTTLGSGSCIIHIFNPDAATTTAAPVIQFLIINALDG